MKVVCKKNNEIILTNSNVDCIMDKNGAYEIVFQNEDGDTCGQIIYKDDGIVIEIN